MEQDKLISAFGTRDRSLAFSSLLTKVYLWMTMGLAMTALSAAYVGTNPQLAQQLLSGFTFYILLFAELGLVFYMSSRIMQMSFATAGIVFAIYAILNGVTLSAILFTFSSQAIMSAFAATAGTFGAMSLVGYFIKRDLSTMGRFLFMALIGLIIATVVNIFLASSALEWGITYLGIFIFSGLTAYDTQKIKHMLMAHGNEVNEGTMKLALLGSLTLYLDFINLFLYLLRFFGGNEE